MLKVIKTLSSRVHVEKTRNEDIKQAQSAVCRLHEMMNADRLLTRRWMGETNDLHCTKR